MKKDIILAGVGGQGILSIAATIGMAAIKRGMFLKQSEVHGMSQRGGDVSSNLRISDEPVFSDLIPRGRADMIIAVEPMESLRHLPMLSPEGWLITNVKPYVNISNYPDIEKVMAAVEQIPHHVALDADGIARDLGSAKSANMVILGAAAPFLCFSFEQFEDAISTIFSRKGDEVIRINLAALKAGRDFALGSTRMQAG